MIKWIVLFGLVMLVGCGHDTVLPFIPGMYVAEWQSEFASSRDTLLISERGESALFDIERRTRHEYDQRVRERPAQYKIVYWLGRYDEGVQALYVKSIGRVMTFDPAANEMKMGIVVYRKL